MKRYNNLWSSVIKPENLLEAHRRAREGKRNRDVVIKFESDLEWNLRRIRKSLLDHSFTTSRYIVKRIYEPKARDIFILPYDPDRIVQHALMNVVEPLFDDRIYYYSVACRKGKGIKLGTEITSKWTRQYDYCFKADVSKFYPSINHEIIKAKIQRIIKDPDVLWLFDDIIDSIDGETNLPIGNYVSQWLGNLYLDDLDLFIKNDLRIKAYVRYCDDFLLFSNDLYELHEADLAIQEFLREKLALKYSKAFIRNIKKGEGVDFLGYIHFKKHVTLRKTSAARFKKMIRQLFYDLHHKKQSVEKIQSSMYSILGWLRYCECKTFKAMTELYKLESEVRFVQEYGLNTLLKIRKDDNFEFDSNKRMYLSRKFHISYPTKCVDNEYYKARTLRKKQEKQDKEMIKKLLSEDTCSYTDTSDK